MTTVLLALGDNALREACNAALHAEGHATVVLDRPLAALSLASKISWQVMLVDDTLLGREARHIAGGTRVLSIGATVTGAHESLPLPLNPDRLIAALAGAEEPQAPAVTLDAQKRLVAFEGREAELTRIEFRLIEALHEHQPEDVSLESLLERVWGTTVGVGTAELVRTHVRNLRQKLNQIGLPDVIRTHRGHGYALEA